MKNYLILGLIISLSFSSFSQSWKGLLPNTKKEYTFFDYQKAFNDYWKPYNVKDGYYIDGKGEKRKAQGWKQFKRWEWYWKTRVDNVTGEFPDITAWEVWQDYKKTLPESKNTKSMSGAWISLGPANLDREDYDGALQENGTGRLNCAEFDPDDDDHFWIGAPSGGVWETTDGGATWTCLTDDNPVIGVSDIAIPIDYDVTGNPTIYIATGDRDAVDDPSIGVLKSTDGGATWNKTGLTFAASSNTRVGRIICSPYDSNTLLAATFQGVYKSTDGGVSWTTKQSGLFIDMELIPTTDTLIATTYGSGASAFRSVDMGETWTKVFTGSTETGYTEYRCDVAVTPANTDIVYLITDWYDQYDALRAIYKSVDGGVSFSMVYDGETKNNLYGWDNNNTEQDGGQGWYDVAFAVSNIDEDVVYVGGVNGYISTDGAANFVACNGWAGYVGVEVVHADHHNAYFRPSDNRLYDVNDGGIYYSDNVTSGSSATFTEITDGIVTGQIYDIGISRDAAGYIVAGFQDNGTKLMEPADDSYGWEQVKGGDGMCCDINPGNFQMQWGTYTNLQVDQTTNLWGSASSIRNSGSAAWAGPLEADPSGNGYVYIGTSAVERYPQSKAGGPSKWLNMSGTLDGTNYLSALDIFNDGTDIMIWTASPAGCWKSPLGGGTGSGYTQISNLPSNAVTDIAIDEDDYDHVYLSFGGFDNVNVWETTDGGSTWTDISSGLPSVPTGSVVINEDNTTTHEVYVGTDAGIYVKLGDAPWQLFNTGMPFVSITDLEMYYGTSVEIYAATYGRGIWKGDCYVPPAFDLALCEIVEPVTEYCDPGMFTPTVKIANIGSTVITSATIEYSINGGTAVSTDWSGSLSQGSSADVIFPPIPLVYGSHTIEYTIITRNGSGSDEISSNDTKTGTYALWDHSMPYTQTFDDFPLGGNTNNYDGGTVTLSECWVNETDDDIDWSVQSGAAPSSGTGPTEDHTTGSGTYLYTESSGPNANMNLKVSSPVIDLAAYSDCEITFWYHMYGANMGTLTVDLYYGDALHENVSVYYESLGTTATSISGDQGNQWYQATIDISAADGSNDLVITFDATTGSDYLSEMAIDDVSVSGTSAAITWNGSVSNDWQTLNNWTPNSALPTGSDDVIIPDVGPNSFPIIDDGATVAECNNLTVESGANITIDVNGDMTVNGSITNNAGNSGLVINSDASGSGSLIHNSVANIDATVNCYLEASPEAWHLISPQVVNPPLTQLPTTNNLYFYDETKDDFWSGNTYGTGSETGWTPPVDNLISSTGYFYYYYQTTLEYQGGLNTITEAANINISYTEHSGTAGNGVLYSDLDGWNLIGNPFTSAIDWTQINSAAANLNNAVYTYDGSNFATWVDGVSTNGGSEIIPAGQGFFVKGNNVAGGTLTIPGAAKVHSNQAFWKSKSENIPDNYLKLEIEADGYKDETVIRVSDFATNTMDGNFDAYKRFSMNPDMPQMYTVDDNQTQYSINTIGDFEEQISVPLRIYNKADSYTLKLKECNFDAINVYLLDNFKGVTQQIELNDEITLNKGDNDNIDRYAVLFEKKGTNISDIQLSDILIYPNPNKGSFYITLNSKERYWVEIINITGKTVYENSFKNSYSNLINFSNRAKGIYFVRITLSDKRIINKKIILK